MENQHFSTSGYLPNGMRVFFEVPFADAASAYETALQFTNMLLSRGLLINAPGLEDGEQKEQVKCFIRTVKTNDDGSETNVIHLYPMDDRAQYKFLTVYLDTADEIAAFEQASGMKLASVPKWPINLPPQNKEKSAAQFFIYPKNPLVAVHKANPHYEEGEGGEGKNGKKKPKRLFVRWDVTQQPKPAPAPQAVVDTSTGEIMDAPQPAPAVVNPTPERYRDPLENEEVTITRVTYYSGGKLREHWKGHATFARPGETSVPVEIDIWEEDRKVLEAKGYPFPKTFQDGDMYIPVVIRKDRGMRRINLDALPARQLTPHAPPEARHPSLDENPPVNPFNGAKAQPQAAAPETAQKPTSKEPDWFQKTLKEQFGLFKTYAQEHIYGTNLYHMKGSLRKHGVADAKDKLTPAWENKTIGEAVKLLNDLRQHEQMEKAS